MISVLHAFFHEACNYQFSIKTSSSDAKLPRLSAFFCWVCYSLAFSFKPYLQLWCYRSLAFPIFYMRHAIPWFFPSKSLRRMIIFKGSSRPFFPLSLRSYGSEIKISSLDADCPKFLHAFFSPHASPYFKVMTSSSEIKLPKVFHTFLERHSVW